MKQKLWIITVLATILFFIVPFSVQAEDSGSKISDNLLSTIITAASVGVALLVGLLTFFHNRATLRESRRAERRKVIEKTLNEFYGPLLSYLNIIKALHRLFVAGKPGNFRTLSYLIDPNQVYETESGKIKVVLSESDKMLLADIIETEKKIENLIVEKGGLVDDPELIFYYMPDPRVTDVKLGKDKLSLLAVAITHFRILRMAYDGNFQSEVERFKDFVYPRELNEKVTARIILLQNELKNL